MSTAPTTESMVSATLEILTPGPGTVCSTVCVCGQVSDYKKKDKKDPDETLTTHNITVTGGGKSCTTSIDSAGFFCCELVGMSQGETCITAVYDQGGVHAENTVKVCVDDENCCMEITSPNCGQTGGMAAKATEPPTIKFQTVPDNAQCRLSAKELPDGKFQEVQALPVQSNETLKFDQAKLDLTKTYILQAELLDANKNVTYTATALQHMAQTDGGGS